MNFEFNFFGAMIALSWALMLSVDSLFTIVIAMLVFFARSIPVDLLFLLSINLIAFIQATLGGQKSSSAGTQKRFCLVLLGLFSALFGVSLGNVPGSLLFTFFGLLVLIPNGLTTIFFNRHYERMTLKAYLQSVLLPAFVALDILLKVKPEMRVDYSQVWDVSLTALGLFTFLYSSLLALVKSRLKPVLIYLSQALIGLALFLFVVDSASLNREALTAISIGGVSAAILFNLASQLGQRHVSFVKVALLGLPGLIWFTIYFFALKMTMSLSVFWLLVLVLGYLLQAITLISKDFEVSSQSNKGIQLRFWITVVIQVFSGVGLYWFEVGGVR